MPDIGTINVNVETTLFSLYMHTYTYTSTNICIYAYMYVYIYVYTCMCVYNWQFLQGKRTLYILRDSSKEKMLGLWRIVKLQMVTLEKVWKLHGRNAQCTSREAQEYKQGLRDDGAVTGSQLHPAAKGLGLSYHILHLRLCSTWLENTKDVLVPDRSGNSRKKTRTEGMHSDLNVLL